VLGGAMTSLWIGRWRSQVPPYSPECVEGLFSEVGLPLYGVLRRLITRLRSSSPCPSSLLGRTKFGESDVFLGRIGINARARSDGLLLLRAIDATQAQGYAGYFFTRLALKLLGGSKQRVVSLLIWGELGRQDGVLWTIKDEQDENIRTSEAAPARSRRSPARATNVGRATSAAFAASCRPSASSLPYLLDEVQRHEGYCSTHY
jgi:hypothetical protein